MSAAEVLINRLPGHDPDLPLPGYATDGSAGLDICACLVPAERRDGHLVLPGARWLAPTGLAMEIPVGFEVQLRPRSGLALRNGLTLLNSPGTIDSDYRGEVGVIIINHGQEAFTVTHGMRIAQMVVAAVTRASIVEAEQLARSGRGTGGFGSTGTIPAVSGSS